MQWKRFQGRFHLAPNQTTGKHTSTCKTAALPQTEQTHGSAGGPAHAAGGGAGGGPQTSPAVPIKPIPIRERPAFLGALLDEKEPVLKFVDANFNRHCSPTDRRKYPCYELKLDALLAEYPKLVFTAHATERARGTDNQEGRDNVLAVKRCLTRGGGMPVTFKPVAFRRERPGEEGRFNLQFNDCMCCCAFSHGVIRVITVLPIRVNWTGFAKRSKQAQMLMAPVPENAAPDREMTISEDCVGLVIGKKGATLERVRQKSAATVKVEVGATAAKVKLYGPPGAVRIAAKMVAELVKYAKASTKTAGQQRQQPSADGKGGGNGKGKGSSPPARVLTKGDKAKARAAELEARQKERTRSAARAAAAAAKAAADAAKASKAGKRKAKGKAKLAKSG